MRISRKIAVLTFLGAFFCIGKPFAQTPPTEYQPISIMERVFTPTNRFSRPKPPVPVKMRKKVAAIYVGMTRASVERILGQGNQTSTPGQWAYYLGAAKFANGFLSQPVEVRINFALPLVDPVGEPYFSRFPSDPRRVTSAEDIVSKISPVTVGEVTPIRIDRAGPV